jgi:lipopolysaccharide/colanic/teichoic acid biosynthesis glycosyltransferase
MRRDAEMMRDYLEDQNHHDDPLIFKMRRDPRVTRIGSILRRTSLDELPNIFNVLRGEMSLVGPRPPLPREVAHYTPHHMRRLAATPGMTGLWQIRGRSEIPFEEMVEIDLEYIERWSLVRDAYIVLMTPVAVVTGRGAW